MKKWRFIAKGADGRKVLAHTSLKDSTYLYHYLQWVHAVEIFENRRLRLSRVQTWTDPYEQWWCDRLFAAEGKLRGVNAYGFCWTRSRYDEPAWRMNGFRDPSIVRIKCRVSSLLRAASAANANASIYLGKVSYLKELELRNLASGPIVGNSRKAATLLLSKRKAFQFEKEIRLLWFDRSSGDDDERFLAIEPTDLVQVMMSPHIKSKALRRKIRQRFVDVNVHVKRSKILIPPHL